MINELVKNRSFLTKIYASHRKRDALPKFRRDFTKCYCLTSHTSPSPRPVIKPVPKDLRKQSKKYPHFLRNFSRFPFYPFRAAIIHPRIRLRATALASNYDLSVRSMFKMKVYYSGTEGRPVLLETPLLSHTPRRDIHKCPDEDTLRSNLVFLQAHATVVADQ